MRMGGKWLVVSGRWLVKRKPVKAVVRVLSWLNGDVSWAGVNPPS